MGNGSYWIMVVRRLHHDDADAGVGGGGGDGLWGGGGAGAGKQDGWMPLAMASLIQNSKGMQYSPKAKTGPLAAKPINILDREARKEAYKALFEDQMAATKGKVAAAQSARTMTPILDAA